MPASLSYSDSDGTKQTVFLIPDGCAIGRRPSKHLICLSSEQVSSGHAWIELRNSEWWLSDLGSANGTFVNDRRVMSSPLRSGDVVRCGSVPLRFEVSPIGRPAPLAGLLYFSTDGQRQTAPLRPEGAVLGSFLGSTVYGEDESICRLHCLVYADDGNWTVIPTTARFETKLNGHTVGTRGTRLRLGDVIQCGALQVRFVLLSTKVPPLSIEQRQAQLHQCPSETVQLSVHAASPLTSSASSMLSAPSGLSTSTKARLTFHDRNQVPVVIEIPPSGGFLGRALECLVKSDDPTVPRKWGRLFCREGRWFFEDLGSSSPSFINDQQQFPHVTKELHHRDTLRNRSMMLVFTLDGMLAQSTPLVVAPTKLSVNPPPPPSSGAYFLTVNDDGETRLIAIPEAGALLGRSRGCLLHTEDPTISRQHARIIVGGDTLQIEDLSKDQGTWIAGVRLVGEQRPLHSGDLVAAGQLRARFLGKNAQFADLDERFRPFRVRCPIGKIGPLLLYWADHPELSATVILRVLPRNAPQYDRWLALLHAESRLLRSHPYSNPTGGTLLRELPDGDRLLSAPLGCGLLLSEFLATYGAPPLPLALELLGQLCSDLDQRAQRDPTRREGQLLVREVWIYADPLAPLSMATRLLPVSGGDGLRPSPILQSPETGTADNLHIRNSQVYVYGLLLYALLSGSLPSYGVPSPKLAAELSPKLPAVVTDLLHELLLDSAARRPDPYHAQRWLADLRSLLVTHS